MIMSEKIIDLSVIDINFKGYYIAAFADEYKVGFWSTADECNIKEHLFNLLELRVFNEETEYKWFRGCIGEEFIYRELNDKEVNLVYEDPIVEYQILDIDMSRSSGYELPGNVSMSKGGRFYLPIIADNNTLFDKKIITYVIVKYYVPKYDEQNNTTMHAYIKDWRLAGFVQSEHNLNTEGNREGRNLGKI